MTIAVNIKVNDGVILATDSATTFMDDDGTVHKVFCHANKLFNLDKRLPVGAVTFGAGSIGQSSIERLVKDFRRELSNIPPIPGHAAMVQPEEYTVRDIAKKLRKFVYEDRYVPQYEAADKKPTLGFIVAGYSSGEDQAEEWAIQIDSEGKCQQPKLQRKADQSGITWNGQPEALIRMNLGFSPMLPEVLQQNGISGEKVEKIIKEYRETLGTGMIWPAMPVQDAIDLADFLVETAKQFAHFVPGAETVGGPTDIAAITKHEGFKWIRRKHYYDGALNPWPE